MTHLHLDDQLAITDSVLHGCRTDQKLLAMDHADRHWKQGHSFSAHLRSYKTEAGL